MNINYKMGKLDIGLEMAPKLQDHMLFNHIDLEIALHVFLTVSESSQF